MLLSYYILRRLPAHTIRLELHIGKHTATGWTMFCREAMMDSVARSSEKVGAPGKTVEIDEISFGRRKYNPGRLSNTTGLSVSLGVHSSFLFHTVLQTL
jgi:hypothetical protein